MVEELKEAILASLPDAEVHVIDPNQDGAHFQAFVISPRFEGLSLVKQHQLVMNPLKLAFETSVHALGLKTFTPQKWEQQKSQYLEVLS